MNWETFPAANAFPLLVKESFPDDFTVHYGLTKREYFAAMALQGLLARDAAGIGAEANARAAVEQADALIAYLNRGAINP
jgi:hypothetical protein